MLAQVRAEGDTTNEAVLDEYHEVQKSVEYAKGQVSTSSFAALLVGRKSGKLHFPRRTQLALWLPLFTQVGTGIAATTIYTPSLIAAAGWAEEKAQWLSALNNTVGIVGTVIAMYTIDQVGRRRTLLWGSLAQSACMWIIGSMSILTTTRPAHSTQYGSASVAFIFVFTLIYSCTFLIINFNCEFASSSRAPSSNNETQILPRYSLPRCVPEEWHLAYRAGPSDSGREHCTIQSCSIGLADTAFSSMAG